MERMTKKIPGNPPLPTTHAIDYIFAMDGQTHKAYMDMVARLYEYEETGLTPDEVQGLKLYSMAAAVAEIKEFDGLPISRLKELAVADKEGRVLIAPAEEKTDPYRQMLLDKMGPDALRLLDMLEGRG